MKKLLNVFTLVALLILTSCGNDDEPDAKFDDVTLTYENTYTIPNGNGIVWESSNDLIASVSGNTIKAEHVGEATISSEIGSFKVTVQASLNSFKEPCFDFGTSKSNIKSFMNSYSGVSLYKEDATTLSYSGSLNQLVILLTYMFENSKLSSSGIALNSNYITVDTMSKFLLERYIPLAVDESDNSFYFINPQKNMAVAMQLSYVSNTIVYIVVYTKLDSTSTRSSVNIKSLFNIDFEKSEELKPYFDEFKKRL